MEENEFKATYTDYNNNPCAFYKAVLRRCANCSRAQKVFIAEREAVACKSPGAQQPTGSTSTWGPRQPSS